MLLSGRILGRSGAQALAALGLGSGLSRGLNPLANHFNRPLEATLLVLR